MPSTCSSGLAAQGTLPEGLAALHSRFGTPARAMDVAAASTVLVILAGSGRVQWLTRAYAIAVAATVVIKAAHARWRCAASAPSRARRERPRTRPAAVRHRRIGLLGCAVVVGAAARVTVISGDGPSIGAVALLGGLVALVTFRRNDAAAATVERQSGDARSASGRRSLARPHRRADRQRAGAGPQPALAQSPDRRAPGRTRPRRRGDDRAARRPGRRRGRRHRRRADGRRAAAAVRSDRRRRAAGPAGAPADRPGAQRLRRDRLDDPPPALVRRARRRVVHAVGRRAGAAARRGLGARRPSPSRSTSGSSSITAAAAPTPIISARTRRRSRPPTSIRFTASGSTSTKTIGPHVHHHDVVRAALRQMEQQLNGPQREEALAAVRQVARLADELAAVLRDARLRPAARHDAQPPRRRARRAAHRAAARGSGRRVPRDAAQGRGDGLRVPLARRTRTRSSRRWPRTTSRRC